MSIGLTLVPLVCQEFLPLLSGPLLFPLNGLLKRERFLAVFDGMVVVGKSTIHGLTQQDDELDGGKCLCHPFWGMRMKQLQGCAHGTVPQHTGRSCWESALDTRLTPWETSYQKNGLLLYWQVRCRDVLASSGREKWSLLVACQ